MTKRPPFSLETHEAKNLKSAVDLAVQGDIGAALAYLIDRPRMAKAFCERLKAEAPSQSISVFTDLIQVLMTEEEGSKFEIGVESAENFAAAQKAAVEGNMGHVAAFLRAHPNQIRPFCNSFLGSFGGIRNAIRLAMQSLRQRQNRDYFDVVAELLYFLINRNGKNVRAVRSRIGQLLHTTRAAEADDKLIEIFTEQARFTLGKHFVYTKVQFRSGGEGDPVPAVFSEDLFLEELGADKETLLRLAQPLIDAGIQVHVIPAPQEETGQIPGYFGVTREALNLAISEGHLVFQRKGDSLEFDILASAKARAAARSLKLVS